MVRRASRARTAGWVITATQIPPSRSRARSKPPTESTSRRLCAEGCVADEVGVEDAERGRGAQRREDPEADDHGGLRPPGQLEVVVDRRHAEEAPPGEPEAPDLE